jgi:signal transduction histidine kinase
VPRALRRGLQRRIFVAFGATIVATALVVLFVTQLVGGGNGWRHDVDRARRFASHQLAAVWNDPPRRHVLVEGIARDLEVGITLYGEDGTLVEKSGGLCLRKPIEVRVFARGTGVRLGRAQVCPTGAMLPQTGRILLVFGAALITVWAASGILAHKLSRPLVDVAEVAREIGRGRLQSRSRLEGRHDDDEAGILADALHDAAARIDKQLADQRALLAAVSHEIRTPLARMRLLVELAQSDPRKFDELDREIVELDVLVADLLAGARVDFSALKPTPIDGAKLAIDALEREGLSPERLEVDGDVNVEGDPTLLGRAVANLVQNAIKHANGVDKIRVARSGKGAGARVSFEVLDRGPGLLPGEESRIFEPFYRRAQTESASGTMSVGLGLSLVRRIAEAHGGRAFAETRADGGARIGFDVRA